ncbi:phosphatase PAP2 family protein [Cupriavidus basilensis]|nr:phosphatase PAP2 family protein [Cupriavidus basilensis]
MKTGDRVFTRGDAIRWMIALGFLVLDSIWLAASGRSVAHASLVAIGRAVAMLAGIALILSLIAGMPRVTATSRGLHYRRLALVAQCGALLVAFTNIMSVMSYLMITLAPPLMDARLAELDKLLGFDWPQVYNWVRARPAVTLILQLAYASGLAQLLLVPMLTGLAGRAEHLREFMSNMILSCTLLLLIAAPWPAAGAYVSFGVASAAEMASVSHFNVLRAGAMQVFDLAHVQGLVSIPSYHTAMALIFVQTMRWTRTGFVVACLLNLAMILSTPTEGGHYLVDVVGGVGLWALTAGLLRVCRAARPPVLGQHVAQPQPL